MRPLVPARPSRRARIARPRARLWALLGIAAALLAFAIVRGPSLPHALAKAPSRAVFVEARVDGVINPIKARHVERTVARARAENARFILLTLDTPGGLVSSMQQIVGTLTNAGIPVITYAEPRSAQATSAGAFILLAGDVATMAPGTRVGAAHPVAQGENLEGAMNEKATNSLAALIKSLAARRGRPTELAEDMVRKSVSFTAEEALEKKLIELVATNRGELLSKLDGRAIDGKGTLSTRGATPILIEVTAVDRILDRLADPTLTSLLLSIGVLAILYELGSPGIGAGGAIGALFVVLGLLGSSVLPIETSALALFVIGFAAIGLEVKVPAHGVLAGAGIVALIIGGMLLVDSDDYFGGLRSVNLTIFGPLVVVTAVGLLIIGRATRKALREPPTIGAEALVGKRGTARSALDAQESENIGQVFVDGARWQAIAEGEPIRAGETVEVVKVTDKPTRLVVRKVE